MGMGEYVCGIEPGNGFVGGRKAERENGTLRFIEPGETVRFVLEFNVLKDNSDIKAFRDKFVK
jgi:hypothetical protein